MTLILLTFVLTTGMYVTLLVLAFCKIAKHLGGNAEAMATLTQHVFIPLCSGKTKDEPAKKP